MGEVTMSTIRVNPTMIIKAINVVAAMALRPYLVLKSIIFLLTGWKTEKMRGLRYCLGLIPA